MPRKLFVSTTICTIVSFFLLFLLFCQNSYARNVEFRAPQARHSKFECIPKGSGDIYNIIHFTIFSDEVKGTTWTDGYVRALIYGGKGPDKLPCPKLLINGTQEVPMNPRNNLIKGQENCWESLVCEQKITEFDHSLSLITSDNKRFPVVPLKTKGAVKRILFNGDTGCDPVEQSCTKVEEWPVAEMAKRALSVDADVFVLLGDFRYHPVANCKCEDNLGYWLAEFLLPYYDVLQKYPVLPIRGNHETCKKSSAGPGWFYLMFYRSYQKTPTCEDADPDIYKYINPYRVILGDDQFIVVDSSYAQDFPGQDEDKYQKTIETIQQLCEVSESLKSTTLLGNCIVIQHHPPFGVKGDNDKDSLINRTFWKVYGKGRLPERVKVVVSGHIHLHQRLTFKGGVKRPVFLNVGNGGVKMNNMKFPANYSLSIDGDSTMVLSQRAFGLDVWTKNNSSHPQLHQFGYEMIGHFLTFDERTRNPIWRQEPYSFPNP